jgi:hypothetical protein
MVDANVLEEDGNQLTARQNHAVNIFFDLCEMPGADVWIPIFCIFCQFSAK